MAFGGLPPIPPVDPSDARAMRRFAEDHQRQRSGAVQDAVIVSRWIWRTLAWPVRALLCLVHPSRTRDERY